MKKLALAPAVAIAITGLAASPVIAAPEAPASADTQPAKSPAAGTAQLQKGSSAKAQAGEESGVTVSKQKLSLEEFASDGVAIVGAKLNPNTEYEVFVSHADDKVEPNTQTVTTDETGAFETGVHGTENEAFVGSYNVVVNNASNTNESHQTTFEVTKDGSDEPEAPEVDPKISVEDKKVTPAELKEDGIKVEGKGFTPGGKVTLVIGGGQAAFGSAEVEADEEGKVSGTVKSEAEVKIEPGEYGVFAADAASKQTSESVAFTVAEEDETEDPTTPAAEAKLTVSPETITPADFVKDDKGVTLAVENCEPGEDVRFLVNPKGESSVTAFDKTVKADDEGKANVNVYGTSASNASAYIGDYDVTVTCGDDELTGDFSVEKDPNAGGGDGNENGNGDGGNGDDNGNGGGDLPRTGTELTGLVGGAGLLLIGGVAVALTMRRKKVAQDPAEI
ncbi:LPXTG cell wall anchor domain-containing protein [Brevibacterium oceani]|uniref:LPXTG cell wall anchor domain-containing protein n=1 Tax=Brevibacterium oceani TaxID=358099 RepID=UPI001B337DA1|nr:LPXTG cell wall anchor domain-containing protein [Brevibacterium oceani]